MNKKLFVVFLALCLMLLPAAVCSVTGPDGCPSGSTPVMVNGQKICQVTGAPADPTPISPGFGNLGEILGK